MKYASIKYTNYCNVVRLHKKFIIHNITTTKCTAMNSNESLEAHLLVPTLPWKPNKISNAECLHYSLFWHIKQDNDLAPPHP